jgi:glycolate dehydrogenase FAD-binding subunit
LPNGSEPSTVEEAAAVLRHASAKQQRVSIDREGGDVVLSTLRLNRVLEHEAGDLTATVEAGIRLSALNERLAEHGQMLALDPPGDPTVGACLAGNLSGPRRHRYGGPRDLVLGVTLVLGNGTIAHSGGKVVKNVAGYDLGKLLCGSQGSLGLIARASLRLHPRPVAARTLVAPVATPDEAERIAQAVHRSTLVPSAVDLLWPGRLALLFEGGERAVAEQIKDAGALLGGVEDDGAVWAEVAERQGSARGRLAFAPANLAATLTRLDTAIVRPAAGAAYLPEPVPESRSEALLRLTERVRAEFDPAGVLA